MTERATELPPYAWDTVEPGQEVGRSRLTVTQEMVDTYWSSMPPGVGDGTAVPFAIWDNETMNLVTDRWRIGGALQARTTWRVERPVTVGEEVDIVARIDDRFERRGRGVIRVHADASVGGQPVGWMEHEHVVPLP